MRRKIQLGAWIMLGGLLTLLSTLPVTWAMPDQKLGRSTMPTRTPEVGVIATMTPESAAQAQRHLPEPDVTSEVTEADADTAASPSDEPPPQTTVPIPTPIDVARGEDQPTAPQPTSGQPTPTAISEGTAEDTMANAPVTEGEAGYTAPAPQQADASFYIPASQVFTLRRTLGLGLLIIGSIVVVLAITRH
jgi:hypothetical protein